jgi:membrane protease YdiL (CAAX protease family)
VGITGAALFYSEQHPPSHWIMWAALPAFLLEAVFYLGSIFKETRAWLAQFRPARMQAVFLWLSALGPYLIFSLSTGTFERNSFYLLAGLTAVLSFWYALLPRRPAYDFGFLVIAAAPIVERVFARIYRSPDEHLQADILGHLMWIRLGIAALLVLRQWDPGAFGFWPRAREWRIGTLYYLISITPIVLLALGLHDVRFELRAGAWWQVAGIGIGTFFGILWVVALSEELFFRGVIERAMLDRSRVAAVLVSAILYGCSHLWVHQFPNWRRAAVGTLLGVVFGAIYAQTGSVRAPMVTHAFVVATWRIFFK